MIQEAIVKLCRRENLTDKEMQTVFREIMDGEATPSQMGSFLTALRLKGETIEEITAAAKIMREKMVKINVRSEDAETIVDTCSTGGSGVNKFNISTTSAFVVAGCGIKVAKHGNRSASSVCGSADVLEELGVNIMMEPEKSAECVRKIGIGFLFARLFHPAMKNVAATRKELGIRTVFNVLGPLASPAAASAQVLGVYDEDFVPVMANVLNNLKIRHAFVVHGLDGFDEVSLSGATLVSEVGDGKVSTYKVKPEDYGLKVCEPKDLFGGDAKENASIVISVLKGEKGPRRDVVLLNAAFAIVCAGVAENIKKGIAEAEKSIDSGAAFEKLRRMKEFK